MDVRLIGRLIVDKLHDRSTYVLALIVGILINGYGQLLVPWFRTGDNPFLLFQDGLFSRPELTMFSVFLAFAFPFCVGIYSGVAARYKNRRLESIADFPERKPDPVFRANKSGQLVEVGASTQVLFEKFGVDSAQNILGDKLWRRIISNTPLDVRTTIFFEAEGAEYIVAYAPTKNDEFNIYLTRVSVAQER